MKRGAKDLRKVHSPRFCDLSLDSGAKVGPNVGRGGTGTSTSRLLATDFALEMGREPRKTQ